MQQQLIRNIFTEGLEHVPHRKYSQGHDFAYFD